MVVDASHRTRPYRSLHTSPHAKWRGSRYACSSAVAAPLIRDTLTFLYDKQKAIAALQTFEQSIGGTLDERIARKTAAWRSKNGAPPLPPKQA